MDIKNILFSLSGANNAFYVSEASDIAYDILSKYAKTEKKSGLTVIGEIKGESDYTIMLDAHIDEVSFVVTNIDENGFLTVNKAGGIDIRVLAAKTVTIHGKEKVTGVFCSTPPHLASGEVEYDDISKIKIDTMLGKKAKDIISVGDIVTYNTKPFELGNLVAGKSFDDRAGVVCLLELAERLSNKKLPCNVVFSLCDSEELGCRGSRTATFSVNPDEAIAIDVSFGDGPNISPDECGKVSSGAMVGIAPVLDKKISDKLIKLAKENNIPYQCEVMGERTGTDCDVISTTREGVKTGLLSIPLRNMHTDAEVLDIADIKSVCDILESYILSGGIKDV